MKQLCILTLAAATLLSVGVAQKSANPFLGRWDLTIATPQGSYPDWLELSDANGKLTAWIQPRSGGAFKTSDVKVSGDRLDIILYPARKEPATTWELTASGDKLTGVQKRGATTLQVAGVRAPKLDRPMPAAWTDPEPIFKGKDLAGWEPFNGAANNWVADNGDLLNKSKGANLRTARGPKHHFVKMLTWGRRFRLPTYFVYQSRSRTSIPVPSRPFVNA